MKKSVLTSGQKIFVVRQDFVVRKERFVLALVDYFYRHVEQKIHTLSKRRAEYILRDELDIKIESVSREIGK